MPTHPADAANPALAFWVAWRRAHYAPRAPYRPSVVRAVVRPFFLRALVRRPVSPR